MFYRQKIEHAVKPRIVAYLTSAYARAGDTFIRGEVNELRRQGFRIHTFSIRREPNQQISAEIRVEQESTTYILEQGAAKLLIATAIVAITSPLAFIAALGIAFRIRTPGLRSLFWHFAYVAEASWLARRLRAFDVQHLHNHIAENSATVAMLASRMAGISFSFTVHGPHEFYVVSQIALAEKISRAKFVACISSFCRSQCMAWSRPEEWYKLKLIHCGLEQRFMEAATTNIPDRLVLVCVGRLCADKAQLLLIEAIARVAVSDDGLKLVLVGDGPMRSLIERRLETLGLNNRVRITGWASSDTVQREIEAASVLVLPSFAEGLPVVIMEALAIGRPVISTFVAGIPELIRPGINGWLVPAGDVEALASAIKEAINTPLERLAEMGRAGREVVLAGHDIRIEARKLSNLFEAPDCGN